MESILQPGEREDKRGRKPLVMLPGRWVRTRRCEGLVNEHALGCLCPRAPGLRGGIPARLFSTRGASTPFAGTLPTARRVGRTIREGTGEAAGASGPGLRSSASAFLSGLARRFLTRLHTTGLEREVGESPDSEAGRTFDCG